MSRRALLPLLLLLAYALFIFSPLIADPDLWGHVRFGLDLLRSGEISRADPYSYLSAGQTWINHEWLTELAQGFAFNLAAERGLIALNLALVLLTLALLYIRLVNRGTAPYGAALMLAAFALLIRPGVLTPRPQVVTYLLFAALLLIIERVETEGASPLPALLVLVVWVNAHGGVLAGFGILLIWGLVHLSAAALGGRAWRAILAPQHRLVGMTLLLAPLALLLNPYGADLPAFLLRTATVPRPEIADWEPARLSDLWSQLWLAGVALTLLALALSRKARRPALLIPLAVTALMPLLSVRHIPLFAVAAAALAAEHFADAATRLLSRLTHRVPSTAQRALPILSVAATVALLALTAPRLRRIEIQPTVAAFPVRAVAVLNDAGISGNLAVEFNWGEYVIWHLGPRVKVSVDGRRETVYADEVYQENLDFMLGRGEWDRLIDRPQTDFALVDRTRPVYALMREKEGWALAYKDETAAIFTRAGSPALRLIRAVQPRDLSADGAGLSFP